MTSASSLLERIQQKIVSNDGLAGRINSILSQFVGEGVGARARRGSIWSFIDFGGSQGLRFVSNLLLTRLLVPEAFGLMTLSSVIIVGLALFSDTGIRPLIVQNDRGDDPDFLNTAWTVQVIRGVILSAIVFAIAAPVAELYDQPQLAQILPVAGLALMIDGLNPTAVHTVSRHLALGRYIRIKLSTQAIGLVVLAALAWQLQSVWALVMGNLIGALITTVGYHLFLTGRKNRFQIEREAAKQIFSFGKWVFLSTVAGFLVNQGDRAILGFYVSLDTLGVYNIGYFLASVPVLLNFALQQAVMMPLYRMKPPMESDQNRKALFRARRLIAASMLAVAALLAVAGPPLVELLYDPRYTEAGAMITLFSLSVVPMVCLNTVGTALIGVGDSRSMFFVVGTTAVLQIGLLLGAVQSFGVPGALIAPGLSVLASYPLRLNYSLKYKIFDPVQDILFTLIGLITSVICCALYWEDIIALF